MRLLVLALFVTACAADHGSATTHPDAAAVVTPDADRMSCDAPANSAHVSIVTNNTTTGFTSVHAGGVISGGDVAPFTAPPMSLVLVFVDEMRLPESAAYECTAPNQGCPYEGVVGRVDCVGCDGNDLGPHPITMQSLQQSVTVQGTLTITGFTAPFSPGPGHITGSISTPDATVVGTFDNDFCMLLLSETI